jgi:hypothetical protein
MILFTSRPMPREYAGRETQKCEFYFSDRSLTGQSTCFSTAGLLHINHADLFSSDRTLTDVLRFRESDAGRRPAGPQVGLSGHGVRKMLAVFISLITP